MSPTDFAIIALWALSAAVAVGALALAALRLMSRATLVWQVALVAVASVASLVGGMLIVSSQMYVSQHDFGVFLWVALVAGLVSMGLAIVLGKSLVRNSRRLVAQAKQVGAQGAARDVPSRTQRHVANEFASVARELAASDVRLSLSREREARAEAARRELVAWISHDLRTPLAGLRAMAEALDDGVADDPARYHRQMLAQVDRLGGMVDDLFQLSTLHAGALHLAVQTMRVTELIDDVVAELGPIAGSRGLRLVPRDVADLALEADPEQLARAVANLVMNSIRLSPPGAEIVLSAAQGDDGFVVLSVSDSAGGIRETDLGRVFEPGWRASSSRTPGSGSPAQVGGAGLGLAIVQGIVQAHAGRVTVANVDAGCRFDLLLPVGSVRQA